MDVRMDGRVAVITGSSTGLGLAMAKEFAASGASVALLARKMDALTAAKAEVALIAPMPPEPAPALDEDAIAQAAAALDAAECPLIFVGGGALDASAEADFASSQTET